MKKLVRIDPRSGRIIDIDQEKLRTVANELLEYLDVELDSNDDIHGVKNSFYPLCNEALSGKILESISPDLSLERIMHGWPDDIRNFYFEFRQEISGAP